MLHLGFLLEHTDVETFFFLNQKINSSIKTGLNFNNEFTHYVEFADFGVGSEIHPLTWKEFLDKFLRGSPCTSTAHVLGKDRGEGLHCKLAHRANIGCS